MGGRSFFVRMVGQYKNANEAFYEAVTETRYLNGNDGYTGTIAEKDSFVVLEVPNRKNPTEFAEECYNSNDGFWNDKWGPAACVEVKNTWLKTMRGEKWKGKRNFKVFYFFGWASS